MDEFSVFTVRCDHNLLKNLNEAHVKVLSIITGYKQMLQIKQIDGFNCQDLA
jgi:hypothetical protein